ncbi:alpha/beta-hydrolase [Piedraia hortae CBS 480.64]|uniref:Alpha/beta-hydrolase n=1 Tax=Piedraia hortae CBS 480.64 TaxID=1314780 RepID=A0A6A7C622_9PEZI|nr:alpha/beta-hydrolase [Piedraia hortae CBS 480.64]
MALTLHSSVSPFSSPPTTTHPNFTTVPPTSWKRLNISGLLVTIYGLDEIQPTNPTTCLWLLHGRGDTQDSMSHIAADFIHTWNNHTRKTSHQNLICATLDQRNHGSRLIDNLANLSWKQGNPTHAQDMFGTFMGTASDVSHLIDHLPSYLPCRVTEWVCCGLSLGGHATWQVLMFEKRVKAGLVIVGCADYGALMRDRAVRSRLSSAETNGGEFFGSSDFPPGLVDVVKRRDPAALFFAGNAAEIAREYLGGKIILCLAGAKDKLVPRKFSENVLGVLAECSEIRIDSFVDPDAGHQFTDAMRERAREWLCRLLDDTPRYRM